MSRLTIADAWDAVDEALPARRAVGPVTLDPGVLRADGRVQGDGPRSAPWLRQDAQTVTGTGGDETGALGDLDDRLRGVPKPDGSRMDELRRRLRLAYVQGAEEWTEANVGRRLTR